MSVEEKQEGQKTVVAFITGLLIGGLLVWVFSSSPEAAPVSTETKTDATEVTKTDDTNTTKTETKTTTETKTETVVQKVEVGEGMLKVADQKAGGAVTLGETSFPTTAGWIVVRDYKDGVGSGVLGAARYNTTDGLIPTTVSLIRGTEAGKSYQVVFFTENGDKAFKLADDKLIEDIAGTFKAE